MLGCKPNVTPKYLAECALDQDKDSSPSTSYDSNSPQQVEDDRDNGPENESERILTKKNPARQKQPCTGNTPVSKKAKIIASDFSNLVQFLQESQLKDHELFEGLAEKEVKRELRSQKLMFDTVKEIPKIFKGNN